MVESFSRKELSPAEDGRTGIAPQQLGRLLGYVSPRGTVQQLYGILKREGRWEGDVTLDKQGRLKWLSLPAAIKICMASYSPKADEVGRWLHNLPRERKQG